MKKKIQNGFILWSMCYAALTVISAIAQLINGGTDTNLIVLARAVICLVPILTYYLFKFGEARKWTRTALMCLIHYLISLGCALLLIYLAGLIEGSSATAYRDIFISFTVMYVIVASILAISNRRAKKDADLVDSLRR